MSENEKKMFDEMLDMLLLVNIYLTQRHIEKGAYMQLLSDLRMTIRKVQENKEAARRRGTLVVSQ